MPVAVKKLRIGRRRSQAVESSPLELALAPAVRDGRWRVPDRFNFTRDVVDVLARDPKRRALTFVGSDGIIEPRVFRELAEGANRWAAILRDEGIGPGDRVLVLSGATVDWVELVLGCVKVGAIVVPSPPDIAAPALESRFVTTGASLLVATDDSKGEIARMSFAPDFHHLFEGRRRRASDLVDDQPTEDTSARDIAFIAWTAGTSGPPKPVAHTHGATHAARLAAEHWLGAGPGDVIWCTAEPGSLQTLSTSVFGAWARGAEVAIHDGQFDPVERLELLHRFDVTIVCQTPAEYRALAGRRELGRYRSRRLRRLVSTGDYLDPDVVGRFEEAWGTTIRDGYGQGETNVVVAHGLEDGTPPDSMGRALPGHHVAIIDDQGAELPHGVEGYLAVRDRPPTLFAGYWDAPDETRDAFRGDWYLTGDVAVADEEGSFWFVARAEDTITSRGRTFGPHAVERVLLAHKVVRDTAVAGIRDLERGGHFVRAFVILEPGVESSEQLEAELRQFVGESLVEQQVPREIEFIDELPRSPSGAVKRSELRERPVAGRPLWEVEVPPTSEPELEAAARALLVPAAAEPPAEAPAPEATVEIVAAPAPPPEAVEVEARVAPEIPPEPEVPGPVPVEALVEPVASEPAAVPAEDAAEVVVESAPELLVEPVSEPVEPPAAPAPPPPAAWEEVVSPPPAPAPEPEVTPEPEPEPHAEAVPPLEPISEPEPPAAPADEPEPEPAPSEVAAEAEPSDEQEPPQVGAVVELVPPPAPVVDPDAEPLPDFVVSPSQAAEHAPSPPPEPAPSPLEEDEEDLGPLPEYIVDPERRLEPVATTEPAPSPPPGEPETPTLPSFPSAPALDLGTALHTRHGDDEPTPPSAPRQRPESPPTDPKRHGSTAEPGDEADETSWMQGLTSRLSAYSLDEEGREKGGEEQDPADADAEPQEKDVD
jgi:acyl-coenzyme A synthetase/AMP-(fatty) acid ligase